MPIAPRRVLVVDDMMFVRQIVRKVLEVDPKIAVVGEAANAFEARQKIKQLKPDVVTLDIEMPDMRGDVFLKQIMTIRPLPVIMLSQSVACGSPISAAAFADGAVDCIEKPRNPNDITTQLFGDRLRQSVLGAYLPEQGSTESIGTLNAPAFRWNGRYLFVGASTGGVAAMEQVFRDFPSNCPPVVVAQHIPSSFVSGLVEWLNARTAAQVLVARHGMELKAGQILVSPGGGRDVSISGSGNPMIKLIEHDQNAPFCPSIDVLMKSASRLGNRSAGAILTGMGNDGAAGLLEMRRRGGKTFAQNERSSVIYGMPKAAHINGGAQQVVDLLDMGRRLLSCCSLSKGEANGS